MSATNEQAEAAFRTALEGLDSDMLAQNRDKAFWLVKDYFPGRLTKQLLAEVDKDGGQGIMHYPASEATDLLRRALGPQIKEFMEGKKAAAAARRAHIDSKKEAKEAASRFQSGQKEAGDVRRFGRSDERDKASIKELKDAAASGKLSPTKQAAVERDIRMRTAREKSATATAKATAKASKDPVVQKRLLQTEVKKVSAKYEKLRGKPEAAAERKKLMDRASEIVKKLGKIDAAASKAAGPKKPDTSLPAQQRRSSAAARARD